MKRVALAEIKDQLSEYLRQAKREEILITRHGKPAGVLIGFESEDDWFDYRLENDPRFLSRIEAARRSLREGHGIPIEELAESGKRSLTGGRSGPAGKRLAKPRR
jgi:prevent-host-death family protein